MRTTITVSIKLLTLATDKPCDLHMPVSEFKFTTLKITQLLQLADGLHHPYPSQSNHSGKVMALSAVLRVTAMA